MLFVIQWCIICLNGDDIMASKTANVLARVEPDVKAQAENILETLGVPTSVLINMLYKQIILTKSIPFSLSVPYMPAARDDMDSDAFDKMMKQGLSEAKAKSGKPAAEVFNNLMQEI